jgi:acyl-CoA thioester hydrolase
VSEGASLRFRLPGPYLLRHRVLPREIDEYRHVNNAVYLRWLDTIAWQHSAALGLSLDRCLELRRGMAVRHTRVDYLQAAVEDDTLSIGTWIVASDGRLRCRRRFEVLRESDGLRLLEAEIDYVCLNLDTGRPSRFPPQFARCYGVQAETVAAIAALPAAGPIGFERD